MKEAWVAPTSWRRVLGQAGMHFQNRPAWRSVAFVGVPGLAAAAGLCQGSQGGVLADVACTTDGRPNSGSLSNPYGERRKHGR